MSSVSLCMDAPHLWHLDNLESQPSLNFHREPSLSGIEVLPRNGVRSTIAEASIQDKVVRTTKCNILKTLRENQEREIR